MAYVRVYAEKDRVTYTFNGTEYRAVIVTVHTTDAAFSGGYEYTIRITSNGGLAYRSGYEFRTTAQFLTSVKTVTRKPVNKKSASRKRAERHGMAQLKEMQKQLMR